MWRINWIHPFYGGNGRTARAASCLVLCARLGFVLPGEKTIPESIVENREPYFDALQAADHAWLEGRMDLQPMEDLMSSLLARQLVAIHKLATGKAGDDSS
jgi:Fic family protein